MSLDALKIRNETPGCKNKIFLDSAGSSLMPVSVAKSIQEYLNEELLDGGYRVKERNEHQFEEFYHAVSTLLNCAPHNIAFAHDATDAYAKALSSINFQPGDTIVTSNDDYISNQINFISLKKRYGISFKRVRNLPNGDLDLDDLNKLLTDVVPRLVAITFIPTNSGLIQNVHATGDICHSHGIPFLVDACQAVGQIQVDVNEIKCDFLTATGRKFLRGPRGSGFLYVSDRLLDKGISPLFIDMRGAQWTGYNTYVERSDAKKFETWESPYALIVGLKEAVKYALSVGMNEIMEYNQKISQRLRNNLSTLSGLKLLDNGSKKCNIITFTKENIPLELLCKTLVENQVYFSVSKKNNALIDFDKKEVDWAIRLSPHYFNTLEEMDKVSEIINGLN